ncbi:ATP-binding protein [Salinarimonas chemoclinalis]|uniref:ATP-binding protein n=1 Tax=Salinarimonas chemoclinalis TaxID=3241599 RepID=UPI0035592A5F
MERHGEDGDEAGGARERASRRAVASGALIATGLLFLVAAATEGVNFWLVVAIPVAVAAAAIAVGERVQARRVKKLVAAGRRLAVVEALLANIPDPVVMVDRRVVVREVNGAARELLPGLRLGHPLSFALRAPQVLDGVEEALRTGERVRVEYAERVPTERVFEVLIGPLDLEADRPGGDAVDVAPPPPRQQSLVLYFRDLTSARRLETMRVDFVANVSHELRTPLSSLLGFVETLQGPAKNDAAARERFLEIMRVQAQRMRRLIDDLLSLSRIELRAHVAPQTPLDVAAATRQMLDTLAPLARERGVELAFSGPAEAALIAGERDELLRVVENLVENAVKYGDGGGRVEVDVSRRAAEAGETVRLAVRDHGPGIAPEHLPRLTERFYRVDVAASREKGGTGLGLAIVKHIVARHRGRLTIESTPGEGALFAVDFPALAVEAVRTPAVSAE